MKQQPDNFFSEKLKGFQKPAPPAAWNRIESNLSKKNDKALWLKVAAALLLLATAFTFIIVRNNATTSEPTAKLQEQTSPTTPTDSVQSRRKNLNEPVLSKDSSPGKPAAKQKAKKTETDQKKKNVQRTLEGPPSFTSRQSIAQTSANAKEVSVVDSGSTIVMSLKESVAAANEEVITKPARSSVKIVYNSGDVEKYLDKKSLAEATSDEKKTSTLKKVLDKAYDLKHNQDPLGELRQKKNEILALNFRNDKQRNQNR
jgi:hypothetical protein